MLDRIRVRATTRASASAVGIYVATLVALETSDRHVARIAPEFAKPDLRFGYDAEWMLHALSDLGPDGRAAYGLNLIIDSVMPVAFAAATILVIARAAPQWLALLSAAPTLFLVLDLIENASFAMMLATYSDVQPALVAATAPITMVKLIAFGIALPTLVFGISVPALSSLRRRAGMRSRGSHTRRRQES